MQKAGNVPPMMYEKAGNVPPMMYEPETFLEVLDDLEDLLGQLDNTSDTGELEDLLNKVIDAAEAGKGLL